MYMCKITLYEVVNEIDPVIKYKLIQNDYEIIISEIINKTYLKKMKNKK